VGALERVVDKTKIKSLTSRHLQVLYHQTPIHLQTTIFEAETTFTAGLELRFIVLANKLL